MIKLTLAGQSYDADVLKVNIASSPHIEVKVTDLNDGSNPEHVPVYSEPMLTNSVAFYKQHGKMTVLFGDVEKNTKNGVVKGILISGPVLKKTRLGGLAIFQQPTITQPKRTYGEEFTNRPRFKDNDRDDKW
jgi:hypothetical protein